MAPKPLSGIRIVEMGTTEVEGIAALLLSDYGAEIICLGPPKEEKEENSQDYRVYDRGKMRIRFRPDEPDDRGWLGELFTRVDVVVASALDIRMSWWNLDVDTLYGRNPGMVYTSVTSYGQTGPYGNGRSYDEAIIQVEPGLTSITDPRHGDLVRNGSDLVIFATGVNVCIGTFMALIDIQRIDRGRRVDVSVTDSIPYGLENQFSVYLKSEYIPERLGDHYALPAPVGDFAYKDEKKVMISAATEAQRENFADVMEHPEWLENPDYRNVGARLKNHHMFGKEVSTVFVEYTSGEWMKRLQTQKCICDRVNDSKEAAGREQIQTRHMFIEITTPDGVKMTVPFDPFVMDGEENASAVVNGIIMCHDCVVD